MMAKAEPSCFVGGLLLLETFRGTDYTCSCGILLIHFSFCHTLTHKLVPMWGLQPQLIRKQMGIENAVHSIKGTSISHMLVDEIVNKFNASERRIHGTHY